MFHELAEKCQAIHPGHFNIKRNDVRFEIYNLVTSNVRIYSCANNIDVSCTRKFIGENFTQWTI